MKIIFFISLVLIASCSRGDHYQSSDRGNPEAFISNGERLYFTGVSISGLPVKAVGGSMSGMHQQMHGGGCASCHGADREGQRLWPRFWIKAPPLTTDGLFGIDDHGKASDGHGDHVSYDNDSLRLAITAGLDPAGKKLNRAMPRWSMSTGDMDDLIAFLKQSHDHD